MRLLTDEIVCELGTIVLAARDGRLCALDYEDCRARMLRLLRGRFQDMELSHSSDPFGISGRIRSYLDGDLEAIDAVPVETGGTAFQQEVWEALRRIPVGETVAYGDLASAVGRPRAARAIGSINALNPIAIAVPCHRLIGRDASLTGYAGGLWRKRWLLNHEGAAAGSPSVLQASSARRDG